MKNRIITIISICISMLLVFVVPIAVRAASIVPLIQLNDHLVVLLKEELEPYINRDGYIKTDKENITLAIRQS